LKIVLCSDYFYPKLGGIVTHIENLALALHRRGHEVTVVTRRAEAAGKRGFPFEVVRISLPPGFPGFPYFDRMEKIFEELRPDVVHAHHAFSSIALCSLSIGRKLGAKTVLTNHSVQFLYDSETLWKPSSYALFPYRKFIECADEIVAVSRAAARFIAQFTDRKVKVIPNGVYVEEFAPRRKRFDGRSLLFVGRLVPRKGLHILLEAMKILVKKKQNCLLTVVGSGCLSPMLKILAESSPLKRNLKVKGQVDKETLVKLYRKAHVFTLPSLFGEAFGITLLEAMASKTPVVATRQGGVGEVVKNGKTGLLVRRGDAEGLAEALLTLLEDIPLTKKLAENAFKEAKKYDWNLIAERLEREVYSQ